MMRSLYSGISGLRNHQTRMDVIGNNIANVNTTGYKTSRVVFQDIFSQNVQSGMASQPTVGGTNPLQIGLGIRLSTVDVLHTRSAFGRTDNATDMMINGDGFFIVATINPDTGEFEKMYTRAGNFAIDSEGYLVNSQGYYVLGYTQEMEMGVVDPGQLAYPARGAYTMNNFAAGAAIPAGTYIPNGYFTAGQTVPAGLFGNGLPAGTGNVTLTADDIANFTANQPLVTALPIAAGHTYGAITLTQIPVGTMIPIGFFGVGQPGGTSVPAGLFGIDPKTGLKVPEESLTLTGAQTYPYEAMRTRLPVPMNATMTLPLPIPASNAQQFRAPIFGLMNSGMPNLETDNLGLSRIRVTSNAFREIPAYGDLTDAQRAMLANMIETGDPSALNTDAFFNMFPADYVSLPGFGVANSGDASVILNNRNVLIGKLAIAMFANPQGLEKAGNSLYREAAASGPVVITEAYNEGAGFIEAGGLEMSNVDMASEFTDMIVTQRGFQANSRIITVSDTMLEELVNLKR